MSAMRYLAARRASRRSLVALAAALSLGVTGCGGESAGGPDGVEAVPLGFIGPLSGGAAYYGRNVERGIQMAVDEIAEAGGFEVDGRRVRFEMATADDRYLPYETATAARRLLQQRRPSIIFVPHAGGIRALQEMNTNPPQFLLAAYSSEPSVLEAGNPLTVMLPPRFDGYQEPFVEVMMERFGTRLGMVPTTTAYGRAWTEHVTAEWRRQGGTVGGLHGVDYNTTTDFTGAVSRALADRPDVLFVGGPSQPTALVIRAAREQGFEGGFLVMDQAKFEEMLQIVPLGALEGSIGVYPQADYPTEGAPFFTERYYERFGEDFQPPTSEIAINYQAVHLFAKAMELAGTTTDPEAIRAAVGEAARVMPDELRIFDMGGVTRQGHLARAVWAAHIVDGQFVPVEIPMPAGTVVQ
ncbi:MAG TPA: ABC transporter substrate-binding protein [Longimicrobiales bacterium]|nr:ABC transporter substrate-binding protein [Longimicrobiales bacterium]